MQGNKYEENKQTNKTSNFFTTDRAEEDPENNQTYSSHWTWPPSYKAEESLPQHKAQNQLSDTVDTLQQSPSTDK